MKLDFMAILKKDSAKRKFCQKSIVFCLGTPKPLFTFAWKSRQNKLLLRRPTITKKPFFRYLSEVYDGCRYGWTLARHATEWYHDMRPPIRKCLSYIHTTVTSTWFEYTICKFRSIRDILRVFCRHVVSRFFWRARLYTIFCFAGLAVLTNGVVLIVQTSLMSSPSDNASSIYVPWVSYFFVARKLLDFFDREQVLLRKQF